MPCDPSNQSNEPFIIGKNSGKFFPYIKNQIEQNDFSINPRYGRSGAEGGERSGESRPMLIAPRTFLWRPGTPNTASLARETAAVVQQSTRPLAVLDAKVRQVASWYSTRAV